MSNAKNPLRFDHKEIAVIFSLFVFVSLLMFTVGILVGKGLSQAHYEGLMAMEAERVKLAAVAPFAPQNVVPQLAHSTGTSVMSPESSVHEAEHPEVESEIKGVHKEEVAEKASEKKEPKLELVPADAGPIGGLKEPSDNKEAKDLINNPKLRNIFEAEEKKKPDLKRTPTSVSKPAKSWHTGKYTVQVGSYPARQSALERVEALKKLGYEYAFFSAKEIREKRDTWFRVWLGYFPDETQARVAGQSLKDRGEVKDYIVREADKATFKN